MRIYDMMVNRIPGPVGYALGKPTFSYKVDKTQAKRQEAAQIRVAADAAMQEILSDSGRMVDLDSLGYQPDLALTPRTGYWWDVTVWADNGEMETSAPAYFETGKMEEPWQGQWITSDAPGNKMLRSTFEFGGDPEGVRAYATGLGLYELYINGQKAGDELLAPFYNDYDTWIQVQTYDLAPLLQQGTNTVTCMLGDGWYMGRFGFRGGGELYGDTQAFLMEAYAADGTLLIKTDEQWTAEESPVRSSSIYDGEVYDATFVAQQTYPVRVYESLGYDRLEDRLSPPVRVTERLAPASIFITPAGETVLDLGQEITGYLEFTTQAPKGAKLSLYYFELLQGGNYYRDNLRTALEEYHYTADGGKVTVRPYFTFYGFRYVKLEGFDNPQLADFTGCVVHSDIPRRMWFQSSNEKVNRFADNVLWGQQGNFLDVPTDCPQRDERMGWTGDAQAFSGTACFQMESAAFFAKYMHDMKKEQDKRGGAVPHVVPACTLPGEGSCAWADAAAVIPWTTYLFYGDTAMLKAQYDSMRDWVEWVYRVDEATGGNRLWQVGFHFADWLALDTKDGSAMGGTDPYFIASSYYFYSTSLLLKAARALGYEEDIARYSKLQGEIFDAIQATYFTPKGHLAQTSQTGYICALFMEVATPEQVPVLAKLLEREFEQTHGKLRTGFVGTAYLCRTLSMVGLNKLAYSLLLNEEYPGWLYEVNMGATTVWERWNSVLPDGTISDTGMNSLNHYAYGAVMEWVYRDVAGLNPVEDAPGFRKALLRPLPDARLPKVTLRYESAVGGYMSAWEIQDRRFIWHIEIPFGAQAKAVFPNADLKALQAAYPQVEFVQEGAEVTAVLDAGLYEFAYTANRPFVTYDLDTPVSMLLADAEVKALMEKHLPGVVRETQKKADLADMPLREALSLSFAEVGIGAKEAFLADIAALGK